MWVDLPLKSDSATSVFGRPGHFSAAEYADRAGGENFLWTVYPDAGTGYDWYNRGRAALYRLMSIG